MRSTDENGETNPSGRVRQNPLVKRFLLYAAVLLAVIMLGLVPMWMKARGHAAERERAEAALRISTLQNTLANAAADARRGEYEPARQAASEFYTNLRTEMERGRDSVFGEAQQNALRPVFDARDDTITLLARNDPASVDRLFDLYNKYRQATGAAAPR